MSIEYCTEVGNQIALRQIRSDDGLRVFSTVKSIGGFRFVEEVHVHEPAGPGYNDYWYWEIAQESGVYFTEPEAFDNGLRSLSWLTKRDEP
jgi:hypothetical protein